MPASPIAITIPAGAFAGTYTGVLTVKDANGTISNPGSIFNVNIGLLANVLANGKIASVTTSSNSQNTSLVYTGTFGPPAGMGMPTKYYIDWDDTANAALLADQPTSSFTFLSNGGTINTIEIPANVPAGTYSGFMYVFNEVSCDQRVKVSITINGLPTIALATSAENACIDLSLPGNTTTTLSYSGTTGNPTTYSIVWNASPVSYLNPVTDAVLPVSPITIGIAGRSNPGTYTGTLTVKNANGAVSSPGSVFTIIIANTPTINTTGIITPVTASISNQIAELAYSGVTKKPTSYSIDWDAAANAALLIDQNNVAFIFAAGGGIVNSIEIPANVPAGTYMGTMYISSETTCIKSQPVSITINDPAPTIQLSASTADVCLVAASSAVTTTLSYTGTTGAPITYSIIWNSTPTNYFTAVNDAELPSSPITIVVPLGTVRGTYTGILTIKNADGVSSSGTFFDMNIGDFTEISIDEPIQSVCSSTNSQTTTVAYSYAEGHPTIYYIDWDQAANNALLQDQNNTAFAVNENNSGIINGIEISANAQPGSYTGTMYYVDGICNGSTPVAVTITSCTARPAISTSLVPSKTDSAGNTISVSILNKVININVFEQKINQVSVYDVSGNLLYNRDRVGDSKLIIDHLRSSNQVLLVRVVLDNNRVENRKVIY
ncbi:T9SS sorting signal type C domain-containing protein [Flavobacterium sp. LS1R49]|uniref:T9SS sorting signal type C domain-containing protein n=1 Tax=Flavobacterium shii TaxID=2987687 RepID=A0A9X2ZDD4_9FLAO|nr:T9SS sorting signal type C domain-containing protein [Flavobacterium shii]MCV9926706.1 T9SS sorting signal type C domain-containing protein [Flavobacterium shii]